MTCGALLTKLTVWLALTAYAIACAGMLSGIRAAWVRQLWTAGGVVFLAHVACAFGFYHGWTTRTRIGKRRGRRPR